MAQCPAGAMGTGASPGNPEDGTWLLIPGWGAVHLQAPKLHREGSVPSAPPPDWDGLANLPPWNKSTISLWVRASTERSGMAPGSSSSGGGGGIPKATRCRRESHPERAGGGGKGAGTGRSGLGHGVLVEVRRYESIKNHFLPKFLSQWCRSLSLSLSRCRSCSRLLSWKYSSCRSSLWSRSRCRRLLSRDRLGERSRDRCLFLELLLELLL